MEVSAMRRWIILFAFALPLAGAGAASLVGAAAGSSDGRQARLHRGGGYFAIACGFSHRNQDDPIVFPGQTGRSHDHTYFGNRATNASSTPDSLRASGRTSCRLRADMAAYWAPTLFVGGRAVEPLGVVAYYVRRTVDQVQPFPAGLKMIAGDAAARTAQSLDVTSWSCGGRRGLRSSAVPTCDTLGFRRSSLRLQVNFPVIYYGIAGGTGAELSSGGQFSAHADFVNAWDQPTLAALVDRYLNRSGYRGKR
jgi:hypothetical protein